MKPRQTQQTDIGEPIALSIAGAAKASGLSRSRLYEAIKDGELQTLKVGGRRLVLAVDLRAWLLSHRVAR